MVPGTVLASPEESCSCTGQIDFPMMRIDVTTLSWKAVEINERDRPLHLIQPSGQGTGLGSVHFAVKKTTDILNACSRRCSGKMSCLDPNVSAFYGFVQFSPFPHMKCIWELNPKAGRGRGRGGSRTGFIGSLLLGAGGSRFPRTPHNSLLCLKSGSLAAIEQSVAPLCFKTFLNSSFQ